MTGIKTGAGTWRRSSRAGAISGLLAAWLRPALLAVSAGGLVLGLLARLFLQPGIAEWIWIWATLPVLAALVVEIVTSLRRGEVGLDIVAALSMSAALAFGEELAGAVVALMYAGGQYLESFAAARARREMMALLGRVPRVAMRYAEAGLQETPIEAIRPGDRLLIRHGEVLPVDGVVGGDGALLDQAALTGESVPVAYVRNDQVLSGSANAGAAFDLVAERPAAESTYAGIIRLVEAAQRAKAPIVRLADRYAIWFLAVTVAAAAGAWMVSGDPIRALSVLVVATPCPLILALPVAIIAGVSRAARTGVLVKGGGALEVLARIGTIVIDKTGTLTRGQARLVASALFGGFTLDEVLRLAASLEQASGHVLAEALVAEARSRNLPLSPPTEVSEMPGAGLAGIVEGRRVVTGGLDYVAGQVAVDRAALRRRGAPVGSIAVAVVVDEALAAVLHLADEVRPEAAEVIKGLRAAGVRRVVMASGDRGKVARMIGRRLGVDHVLADLSPEEKVAHVQNERRDGPVMMVGDGVNDAPALAAADLGVAMGARGAAAASEAADVVLLVDRLDRLLEAMRIAQGARRIALQSVFAGIGLSFVAMGFAAAGHLSPVQGALLQEVIDVAVILNALRVLQL